MNNKYYNVIILELYILLRNKMCIMCVYKYIYYIIYFTIFYIHLLNNIYKNEVGGIRRLNLVVAREGIE